MKVIIFNPIPPTPFPVGRGRFRVDYARGLRPLATPPVRSTKVFSLGADAAQARITFSAVGGDFLGAPT